MSDYLHSLVNDYLKRKNESLALVYTAMFKPADLPAGSLTLEEIVSRYESGEQSSKQKTETKPKAMPTPEKTRLYSIAQFDPSSLIHDQTDDGSSSSDAEESSVNGSLSASSEETFQKKKRKGACSSKEETRTSNIIGFIRTRTNAGKKKGKKINIVVKISIKQIMQLNFIQ